MGEISIQLGNVENIKLGIQMKEEKDMAPRQVTKVAFETDAPVREVSRVINLQRRGVPIVVKMESPQAEFDIKVETVNTLTGEVQNK